MNHGDYVRLAADLRITTPDASLFVAGGTLGEIVGARGKRHVIVFAVLGKDVSICLREDQLHHITARCVCSKVGGLTPPRCPVHDPAPAR